MKPKSDVISGKLSNTLPENIMDRLVRAGVDQVLLSEAKIQVGSRACNFITRLFHSAATTIGRTIYFHPTYFDLQTKYGLGLIAHELVHVRQWKKEGIFYLIKYGFEFIVYGFQSILARLRKETLPQNWVHDQISYEKEAIQVEMETRTALRLIQ